MLELKSAIRKPFPVKVAEVTVDNMEEVASWCGGQVRQTKQKDTENVVSFVQVKVQGTATPRQKTAFVGDFVLFAGKGYKVYTPRAFKNNFDLESEAVLMVPTDLDHSADQLELVQVVPVTKEGTTPPYLRPSEPTTLTFP